MEMPLRGVPADRGAHVQSEPRTFEAFYWSVHRPLFGAPRVITGNRTDAEDISRRRSSVSGSAGNRVALMDNPEAFPVSDGDEHLRNRSRRARLALRRTMGSSDPRDELAEVEDRDLVERALRPLTPRERAAVVLTCYVGLTSARGWPGLGDSVRRGANPYGQGQGVAMKTAMEESR